MFPIFLETYTTSFTLLFFVEIQSESVASSGLLFSRKGPKFISNKFIVDNGETAQNFFCHDIAIGKSFSNEVVS